jgi:hypothetical protein
MDEEAVERALGAYFADVRRIFAAALAEVRGATGSKSAAEANSKFDGFEGNFASLKDFHAGAEATLNLGYPNPDTMKGILLEYTAHPSVERLFVTPNYRLATALLMEYWWVVCPFAPPKNGRDLLSRLRLERDASKTEHAGSLAGPAIPGEVTLSLIRGESKEVDIDSLVVTFRCSWTDCSLSNLHFLRLCMIFTAMCLFARHAVANQRSKLSFRARATHGPQRVEHGRGALCEAIFRHLLYGGGAGRDESTMLPPVWIRRRQLRKQ